MPEPTVHSSDPDSSPYLEQLAQLATSVPDLAATLTTQAEQDAEDDNISFLRTELPEEDMRTADDEGTESRRRHDRGAADAMVNRVYTPQQLQQLGAAQDASDTARLSRQQYEYTGWAPGALDDEEDAQTERPAPSRPYPFTLADVDEQDTRRDDHLRDRMRLRRLREGSQMEWRDLAPPQMPAMYWEGQQWSESRNNDMPTVTESSLRTTALLQAVRRNPQFSARSRNELQRYILDRERGDDRDRASSARQNESPNGYGSLSPSQRRQFNREATVRHEIQQHRDLLVEHQQHRNYLEEQIRQQRSQLVPPSENRRRRYWQTPSHCQEKRPIDDAIKYLGQLRLCESDQEGQKTAEDGGFDLDGSSPIRPDDFLFNTQLVPRPPRSSWLKVGSVLSGTQHGANPNNLPSYTPYMPPTGHRSRSRTHFGAIPPQTTSSVRQPPDPSNSDNTPLLEEKEERWPVKVTIHSVDYNNMTLTGTMEAFNVPDKSSPTKESSITTYLEGEIIDFNTFSLETKSFKADARVDGTYWRKLPPFKGLSDDEAMVKRLLSTGWLREELMQKWILMRWKEKCFVTPSDAQTALTISGFYYVSLRREDGHVEGLYYDPHSNPYQHLSLMPEKRTFPTYEFL